MSIEIGSTMNGLLWARDINNPGKLDVLFVGQNPSAKPASKNTTFDRLNEWTADLGIDMYGFVNACSVPGKVTKAQVDLDNLRKAVYSFSKVVALGNFASEALTSIGCDHFKLPHPSPLNRQINDKQFISNALSQCRQYLSK